MDKIHELQTMIGEKKIPDLIIISEESGLYRVQETYCQHDKKGKVIKGSGVNRIIYVKNQNDYSPPEGYNGVIIRGDIYD